MNAYIRYYHFILQLEDGTHLVLDLQGKEVARVEFLKQALDIAKARIKTAEAHKLLEEASALETQEN